MIRPLAAFLLLAAPAFAQAPAASPPPQAIDVRVAEITTAAVDLAQALKQMAALNEQQRQQIATLNDEIAKLKAPPPAK